jgi:hypothetical protein
MVSGSSRSHFPAEDIDIGGKLSNADEMCETSRCSEPFPDIPSHWSDSSKDLNTSSK